MMAHRGDFGGLTVCDTGMLGDSGGGHSLVGSYVRHQLLWLEVGMQRKVNRRHAAFIWARQLSNRGLFIPGEFACWPEVWKRRSLSSDGKSDLTSGKHNGFWVQRLCCLDVQMGHVRQVSMDATGDLLPSRHDCCWGGRGFHKANKVIR